MQSLKASILGLVGTLLLLGQVNAAGDRGTADEASSMLGNAEAHYKAVGRDQALKDFSEKGSNWVDRDLYVFCMDDAGVITGHGANSALVGRDLSGLKDANGKKFIVEIISTARAGGGWVDYLWPNPTTNKLESKSSTVKGFGDDICGVGIFK
ncbi:cache domain-containing protein [Stappia sp. F7233]|uniref:Cache domain-containing protein n=1 Tax=Stappia albiluteola TaxID=2758565 RepID=A0A839AKE3_9HYPH|nr:cache domain-containing protein [Stappia albiluteola]MBA5779352.1 cache domain-containing protein [Stappia albiluteola]